MSETHDWSSRDYVFNPLDGGQRGWASFWEDGRPIPKVDDYLLLRNGDRATRYQVVGERDIDDPEDQHLYDLKFAPRS